MSFPDKYNPADAQDILRYAKWLLGKSFYDVLAADVNEVISPKPHLSKLQKLTIAAKAYFAKV